MDGFSIRELDELPDDIAALKAQAVSEGFRFLTRLVDEWQAGTNRFDRAGECLLGAFQEEHLIAIGGLTQDPHANPDTGRLRRIYVEPGSRGRHVGRALVQRLLEHATRQFRIVRLSTDASAAAAFYLRCGFELVSEEFATHAINVSATSA